MSKDNWQQRGHTNRSLFWPLTLIILGLVFLAYNLGMLNDDVWSTLINLWPLLLVLIGLDGLLNRNGVVGPSLMIGLGVIFLLNNFGYLVLDVWQLILSLWPVLLIAIGFDILIGRRSWLLSLIGVMVVLAILIGAIGLMGSTAYATAGQEIRYPLEGVERAEIDFSIPVGSMTMNATSRGRGFAGGAGPGWGRDHGARAVSGTERHGGAEDLWGRRNRNCAGDGQPIPLGFPGGAGGAAYFECQPGGGSGEPGPVRAGHERPERQPWRRANCPISAR